LWTPTPVIPAIELSAVVAAWAVEVGRTAAAASATKAAKDKRFTA
jgi:hypothetical protein